MWFVCLPQALWLWGQTDRWRGDRPGVQIGSHINKWNLDSPELTPFWAEAEALGAVVFVHPWDMEMGGRHDKHWLPWLVGMP